MGVEERLRLAIEMADISTNPFRTSPFPSATVTSSEMPALTFTSSSALPCYVSLVALTYDDAVKLKRFVEVVRGAVMLLRDGQDIDFSILQEAVEALDVSSG